MLAPMSERLPVSNALRSGLHGQEAVESRDRVECDSIVLQSLKASAFRRGVPPVVLVMVRSSHTVDNRDGHCDEQLQVHRISHCSYRRPKRGHSELGMLPLCGLPTAAFGPLERASTKTAHGYLGACAEPALG